MINFKRRVIKSLYSTKTGLVIFTVIVLLTAAFVASPEIGRRAIPFTLPNVFAHPNSPVVFPDLPLSTADLRFNGTLSHSKIVQNQDGTVYLNLEIDVPRRPVATGESRPSDIVVILDRSGSMSDQNKLGQAKNAIKELVSRLSTRDRFALISFDHQVTVHQPLAEISSSGRRNIRSIVSNLRPGGSTNMGAALQRGLALLQSPASNRNRSVILLSDGHANMGITNPADLIQIGKRFTGYESPLSTIGIGLGFNETLMSSLADHGMGSYSFLESLASLDAVFARILEDSQAVFASGSTIHIKPESGVQIVNASGYPIERVDGSVNSRRIPVGQLVGGRKKQLTITLRPPTVKPVSLQLADLSLHYQADGRTKIIPLAKEQLAFEVVEPARKNEALASFNEPVWKKSWLRNNLGVMQSAFQGALANGDRVKASSVIADYKKQRAEAEKQSNITLNDEVNSQELQVMEENLRDAFEGSLPHQAMKQSRYSKKYLSESLSNSRTYRK